jgi:hypothetical protein
MGMIEDRRAIDTDVGLDANILVETCGASAVETRAEDHDRADEKP